jgi:hypothetical protein
VLKWFRIKTIFSLNFLTMSTLTKELEDKKQQEIVNIVADYNQRSNEVFEFIKNRISISGLDDTEKQSLQKCFEQPVVVAVPTMLGFSKQKQATIAMAREIFGPDFIDQGNIAEIFDGRVKFKSQPKDFQLPFTIGLLEEAKSAGCVLIYQPIPNKNGGNIGLDEFAETFKGMKPVGGGVLLYADQFDTTKGIISKKAWFAEKQYSVYREQQIITGNVFRLAMKSEIPGTANKKFVQQMLVVCNWMENSFKSFITDSMKAAIAEVRKNETMLTNLQDNDSAKFIQTIKGYRFFTLCMETGLETFWRMLTYNQVAETKLLPGMYLRNKVIEPVECGPWLFWPLGFAWSVFGLD